MAAQHHHGQIDGHDGGQLSAGEQLGGQEGAQPGDQRRSGWAGWVISGAFHALMLSIMAGIYWAITSPVEEVPPTRYAALDPPAKKQERQQLERTLESKLEISVPESDTIAPISVVDPVEVETQREEPTDNPTPKGREEAVSDTEMGGQGVFVAMGAGGSGAGMFGNRTGGGRHRAVGKYGGSRGSESAVDAALRWFKRHQSPNGRWDTVNYFRNCAQDLKCEPGVVDHCNPAASDDAMTGYALLCFLGAGYDHKSPNMYKSVVAKGLGYLRSIQQADGCIGDRNYENAVATMALCEAFAMTGDPELKGPAQKGVDQILAHQNQFDSAGEDGGYGKGFGWDYVGPSARNDSSVTGWNVMALKSALAAGLDIGNGMEGAKRWLDQVWKKTNPEWARLDPYTGESRFPYTCMADTGAVDIAGAPGPGQPAPNSKDLTCVGGVCAVFLGHHAGDPMLESLSNYIINHEVPSSFPTNAYYMYYNTLTIFQVGGEKWRLFNTRVRDLLVKAQRRGDGCFDGSWDYGNGTFIGSEYGRVLTTAYCTLDLEVYYRYLKIGGR